MSVYICLWVGARVCIRACLCLRCAPVSTRIYARAAFVLVESVQIC